MQVHDLVCDDCMNNEPDILNSVMTQDEILFVINSMHDNKASGHDNMVIEMFKCCKDLIVPYLKIVFNYILG